MMRKALVKSHNVPCGYLEEIDHIYRFTYFPDYHGSSISLTLPVRLEPYISPTFFSFFEGLLPEGQQLDALLRINKIDATDYFSQILAVGEDLVGAVTVHKIEEDNK